MPPVKYSSQTETMKYFSNTCELDRGIHQTFVFRYKNMDSPNVLFFIWSLGRLQCDNYQKTFTSPIYLGLSLVLQ